ncbi:MAG: tetratricopeptide repeat protein, partial [Pseudomonadota bacterium]
KTLMELNQSAHAIKAFSKAVKLKGEVAEFHNNLGHALRSRGEMEKAVHSLKQAIAIDPNYALAYQGLGGVMLDQQVYKKAVSFLLEAVRLEKGNADNHALLGVALNRLGKIQQAAKSLKVALHIDKKNSHALSEYATMLEGLGEIEQAKRAYRHTLTNNPNDYTTVLRLCSILMTEQRYTNIISLCDQFLEANPGQSDVVSMKIMAHLANGGNQIPVAELMDFERFFSIRDLPPDDRYQNNKTLNATLAQDILAHSSLRQYGARGLTRFGRNTTDIFATESPAFVSLASSIRLAVEDYIRALNLDDHTFVKGVPGEWQLSGYGVVIEEQGAEPPRIRSGAWLSGIYFVRLPTLIETTQKNPGWVEFGRPDREDLQGTPYLHKIVRPQEGNLFLFPSYFFHNNVPFESELERVTVRFDVSPL